MAAGAKAAKEAAAELESEQSEHRTLQQAYKMATDAVDVEQKKAEQATAAAEKSRHELQTANDALKRLEVRPA